MLKLENFSVTYPEGKKGTQILTSIDLSICKGQRLAVLGLSGSGKTSLVRALANNWAKPTEVSGSRHADPEMIVHFVSQNSYESFHNMRTLGWHLEETLRYSPRSSRLSQVAKEKLLEDFLPGVHELLKRHPYEVSGGQLLRFNLAVGVLRRPDVFIADEPTAALDETTSLKIAKLIKTAAEITSAALVIATHDLNVAKIAAEQAVLINDGKLAASGEIDVVANQYVNSWGESTPLKAPAGRAKKIEELIQFNDVEIGYKGKPRAISIAELNIKSDSRMLIVGRSGSGKSTLLRSFYDSRIELKGHSNFPINGDGRKRAAGGKLGVVFQDTWSSLNPRMAIREILAEAIQVRGIEPTETEIFGLLSSAGLDPSYSDRTPDQLSGGQRQRVAILRALANHPRLVIMDEPTSQLDPVSSRHVLALIQKACHSNAGLIISSHKPSEFDWFYNKKYEIRYQELTQIR